MHWHYIMFLVFRFTHIVPYVSNEFHSQSSVTSLVHDKKNSNIEWENWRTLFQRNGFLSPTTICFQPSLMDLIRELMDIAILMRFHFFRYHIHPTKGIIFYILWRNYITRNMGDLKTF